MMYKTQDLHGTWQLEDNSGAVKISGSVPGTVLSDLLAAGEIEDPYWRCNEYAVRERMEADYSYRRTFTVEAGDLKADRIELVCEGLDTIASVCLNGSLIGETSDMHRTYRFPIGEYLRDGENRIQVLFRSPVKFVKAEDAGNDIFYASTGCMHGNAALRKAHYMFGWDWGPQLPDCGIFRGIRIEYTDTARLDPVYIRQFHEPDGRVRLTIESGIRQLSVCSPELLLKLAIRDPDGQTVTECTYPGDRMQYEVSIDNPQLWWPHGLGGHPLYEVKVTLTDREGNIYDQNQCRIGLRTVTVSTDAWEWGNEFAITVNGIKIFTMGANYIPEDNLLTRVTKERSEKLIEDCVKANFNCLRIWGGGYYPDDYFYDKCDEAGILIWQDLMFGCNVYALTDGFEENIIAETKDITTRLRNHACLALWCGNNEMEWGWGDEWARIKGHHPRYKADYIKIFEHILPRAIRSCDEQTFYWPSSPSSGGSFDQPNEISRGDQHYWEVWHSGKPFTEYGDFSFCSEYGFQSFPHSKTIASFTLPEDRNIFSRVMESHQKNGTANGKILGYVADYFLYPRDTDSLAYISQVLQQKAIEYGVGHWRRQRGRCMGSLYWQLNDCWPVASWSSIDYYGRWKALHYGARRFYAPVTISIREEQELSPHISFFLHNDTREAVERHLEFELRDRDFRLLWKEEQFCRAEALSAVNCFDMDFSGWTQDESLREEIYCLYRLCEGGQTVTERTVLFVKPKHFRYRQPHYEVTVAAGAEQFDITVKAAGFCQYVELYFDSFDVVFSDNFFDLTTADGVTVSVDRADCPAGMTAETLKEDLVIRSVADSYLPAETEGRSQR